jgi:hypothetical protein
VAQVEKGKDENLQYVQKGDTLQITGKATQQGFEYPATFYLPHNATVSVFNSSVSFVAGKKPTLNNPVIYLQKSHAIFPAEESPVQLGHVRVVASDNSLAIFHKGTRVEQLDVQLSNSALESAEGNFGQLSIITDSLSRISLPAKQLLKANIRTTTPE